jgi:hypothetical protein
MSALLQGRLAGIWEVNSRQATKCSILGELPCSTKFSFFPYLLDAAVVGVQVYQLAMEHGVNLQNTRAEKSNEGAKGVETDAGGGEDSGQEAGPQLEQLLSGWSLTPFLQKLGDPHEHSKRWLTANRICSLILCGLGQVHTLRRGNGCGN